MRKGVAIATMVLFAAFALGVGLAQAGLTIDAPAAKFPAKKLNADGTKKKNPVTFDHDKHGKALGCATCHHTQKELVEADLAAKDKVKSCFECHGPEAKDKQVDSYEMIHSKTGKCVACHKTDEKAKAAGAPKSCKDCHGGADE